MIEGKQIIGFDLTAAGTDRFQSVDPATGTALTHQFHKATQDEINNACEKAAAAFQVYRKKSGEEKASFLEAIGREIKALEEELIDLCVSETALPKARIEGERGRTINQLNLFAALLREGSWLDARIETSEPARAPIPKPDIRSMQIALGPVVVFGASNFPLAFSVAGGDTASALAAGCPVIVKGHPAHPGTSELVGKAIQKAARAIGMPDGVFSLLQSNDIALGTALVKHPLVKAVGFTGSYKAGKALFDIAAARPNPIPVYAEMGSTNPVFILPEAMREHKEKFAQGFAGSVTLGVGQFCTNPGMLIHEMTEGAEDFSRFVKEQFEKTSGAAMLGENIFKTYNTGVANHTAVKGVEVIAKGTQPSGKNIAGPVLFKTTGKNLMDHADLAEEIFGPTSLVVEANSKAEVLSIARKLSGHLTATVHGTEKDLVEYKDLLDILEQKVGRVVINGFPTGVEVCHAMVHGGPFPATSDSRSTSVGTIAIHRFTRPFCYQSMPQVLLPPELKNENPLQIWRLVNGERTKNTVV